MRPTLQLGELIATHMSTPGNVSSGQPVSQFVMSGLRAATSASLITRQKILSDISDVLDCKPNDLNFLFSEFPMPVPSVDDYDVMMPDFQSTLLACAE